MSLEAQVQANTTAIQEILANVKTLAQLSILGSIENDDYIIILDSTDGKPKRILKSNFTLTSNSTFQVLDFGAGVIPLTVGYATTNQEIVDYINSVGFTITIDKYAVLSIISKQLRGGRIHWVEQRFLFAGNDLIGTYGTASLNGEITYSDLIFTGERILYTIGGNEVLIDLGEIGENLIETYINNIDPLLVDWEYLEATKQYFFTCTVLGESRLYAYVGDVPVTLCQGGYVSTAADYDLINFNNTAQEFDVNVKSIGGFIVDTTNNTNINDIEIGNIIIGPIAIDRFIIAYVKALPYTDEANLDIFLDSKLLNGSPAETGDIVTALVGYYKFNELSGQLLDYSGNNYNGNNTNVNYGNAGVVGTGYLLNPVNTDGFIDIPSNADFQFGSEPFGIEIWIRPNNNFGTVIGKYNNTTGDKEWRAYIQSGIFQFYMYTTAFDYFAIGDNTLNIGAYNQIFITYDGSGNINGLKLKVNNVLSTFGTSQVGNFTGMPATNEKIRIGNRGDEDDSPNRFAGYIDILRIWKGYAPTDAEQTALYNSGAGSEA